MRRTAGFSTALVFALSAIACGGNETEEAAETEALESRRTRMPEPEDAIRDVYAVPGAPHRPAVAPLEHRRRPSRRAKVHTDRVPR